ncbi:membrane protein [Streptomyces phage Annihilus]|nr:hypothetical protein SEA_MOOZY_31 [Streptomyces phage Moozy]UQT02479.1 membrane protein [Streptomyces phage Annihilus]
MRFSKYLAKTFLVFAASGAGTAFGAATVTLGAIAFGSKVMGLKASTEVVENEEKAEESK